VTNDWHFVLQRRYKLSHFQPYSQSRTPFFHGWLPSCRREGFDLTANAAAKRLEDLNAGSMLKMDDATRKRRDQEFKESYSELCKWTVCHLSCQGLAQACPAGWCLRSPVLGYPFLNEVCPLETRPST
jgi:hypothetical protein